MKIFLLISTTFLILASIAGYNHFMKYLRVKKQRKLRFPDFDEVFMKTHKLTLDEHIAVCDSFIRKEFVEQTPERYKYLLELYTMITMQTDAQLLRDYPRLRKEDIRIRLYDVLRLCAHQVEFDIKLNS